MNDVIERVALIRDAIEHARSHIVCLCPDGRERALALTKLDEARLWGIEAATLPDANHSPR
jgi:hypothetical protein